MATLTKGKVWKVWIDIEEYDIEEEHGELVDCSTGCTATFATPEEADALAERMHAAFEDAPGQVQHE